MQNYDSNKDYYIVLSSPVGTRLQIQVEINIVRKLHSILMSSENLFGRNKALQEKLGQFFSFCYVSYNTEEGWLFGKTIHNYRPQGKVMFSQVSVCPQLPSWALARCSAMLRHGRYAPYWNAFLFPLDILVTRRESRTW